MKRKYISLSIAIIITLIILFLANKKIFVCAQEQEVDIVKDNQKVSKDELKKLLYKSPASAGDLLDKLTKTEDDSEALILKPPDTMTVPFKIGERLEFEVKYGFMKVGSAVFNISKALPLHNRNVFMLTSDARTSSFFDAFYRVRDRIISYIDAKAVFSYKYIKIQREGSKKINEVYNFLYNNKKMVRYETKFKDKHIKHYKNEIKLDSLILDPFASLYYLRTVDFKVGDSVKFKVNSSDDIYELRIDVLKKERIKVPAGKFMCYKVVPSLLKEGIFIHKGKMYVWLTADKYKIPVMMKSKMVFGSVAASLKKYQREDKKQ